MQRSLGWSLSLGTNSACVALLPMQLSRAAKTPLEAALFWVVCGWVVCVSMTRDGEKRAREREVFLVL